MAGGKYHRKTSLPFWKSQTDPSVQEHAPTIPWLVSQLSAWDQKPGFNAAITSSPNDSSMGSLSASLQSTTFTFLIKGFNCIPVFIRSLFSDWVLILGDFNHRFLFLTSACTNSFCLCLSLTNFCFLVCCFGAELQSSSHLGHPFSYHPPTSTQTPCTSTAIAKITPCTSGYCSTEVRGTSIAD